MNWMDRIVLGLGLALLLCLLPLPYGYYSLVRLTASVVFGFLAIDFYKEGRMPLSVGACSLVLLFQPFYKVALGRSLWGVVDVVVAVALVVLWWYRRKSSH